MLNILPKLLQVRKKPPPPVKTTGQVLTPSKGRVREFCSSCKSVLVETYKSLTACQAFMNTLVQHAQRNNVFPQVTLKLNDAVSTL